MMKVVKKVYFYISTRTKIIMAKTWRQDQNYKKQNYFLGNSINVWKKDHSHTAIAIVKMMSLK